MLGTWQKNIWKLPESEEPQKECLNYPYDEEMSPPGNIFLSSIFEMNDNPEPIKKAM